MKLYYDPVSTTSRPLMMFAAEHDVALDWEIVSLFQEENRSAAFMAINPNACVPVLVDGDFVLTECSVILEYLAERVGSPALPRESRQRAQVRSAMSWFMTNCHSAIGPGFVYPTIYRSMFPFGETAFAELTAAGRQATGRWMAVLDRHLIGDGRNHVAGHDLTIADYLGASVIALLEAVDFDFSLYPNVRRWLSQMKARPSWAPTFAAFEGLRSALRPAA